MMATMFLVMDVVMSVKLNNIGNVLEVMKLIRVFVNLCEG